jgi:cellulose synthase/poly-beta-1,6-N-acetylglucosamine synthase-like glycosyltransferase
LQGYPLANVINRNENYSKLDIKKILLYFSVMTQLRDFKEKSSAKKSKFSTPAKEILKQDRPWLKRDSLVTTPIGLPIPPNGLERFIYDTKNQKWPMMWQILSSLGLTYSFTMFSLNNFFTALFLLPTLFFVIFVLVNLSKNLVGSDEWDYELHADRVGLFKKSNNLPTIDIFLPSAGEDLDVLENTYYWVSKLEWPAEKIDFYIMDDSDRIEVVLLAEKYGFNFLVRPNRGYLKKSGNLLHAFKQSSGDLIAVFDADFVPAPEYLFEMASYFEDPSVGIVQSPQFFDTDATKNWLQRGAGAVQELFYRAIQVARSRIGSPICCGTSAVYRRAGLVEAGGFVQIEHSEDVYTGIALRRQGFRTIYIPAVLTKGLCPDGAKAFFNQQYRWCAGSMTLMRDKDFWNVKMSFMQRICYISGFLYFLFTASWIFFGFIPVLTMVFFLPQEVRLSNYIPLIPSIIYAWIIHPNWHRSKYGFETQAVKLITAYAHFFAIKDIFFGTLQGWIPTGESGASTDRFTFFRELNVIWGVFVTTILLVGSLVRVLLMGYQWYDWIGIFIFGLISLSIFSKVHRAPGSK